MCLRIYHKFWDNLTIIQSHLSKFYLLTARIVEHMYMYMQNMYTEKSAQHFTIRHYPGTLCLIVPAALMWLQPCLDWLLTH